MDDGEHALDTARADIRQHYRTAGPAAVDCREIEPAFRDKPARRRRGGDTPG